MKKKCQQCGKVFETKLSRQVYCTNKCKKIAEKKRKRENRQKEKEMMELDEVPVNPYFLVRRVDESM